jgi:hypothetical protein
LTMIQSYDQHNHRNSKKRACFCCHFFSILKRASVVSAQGTYINISIFGLASILIKSWSYNFTSVQTRLCNKRSENDKQMKIFI